MSDKNIKTIDHSASDNVYLHKDFHGALCYAIKYLDDNFGPDAAEDYLKQVARTYFAPLTEKLKEDGLSALEKHWNKVFNEENGNFSIKNEGGTLILTVNECPAIAHMKKQGYFYTDRYCLTTVVVNETVCAEAGYQCSCHYERGEGKCVQKFWKSEGKQ
jgi:hypothetical protein